MDVRCVKCGEPWDIDSLHEEVEMRWPHQPWKEGSVGYDSYFNKVQREFHLKGCSAIDGAKCSTPTEERDSTYGLTPQEAASALHDILGDDIDGIASELEDLFG